MSAIVLMLVALLEGEVLNSRKNIFKGEDYTTPQGKVESRPNIFGGMDFFYPDGRKVRCRPNPVTKGQDCKEL